MDDQAPERSWHRLRPLEHDDVPEVATWFRSFDDLGMFAAGIPVPPSAATLARRWAPVIDGVDPVTSWFFVAEDPAGELVAFTGIEDANLVHGTAITPLWVAAHARRRRIGVLVRALVLDIAFRQLGLHRVVSMHRADNDASRRVNEACGLVPEGTLREGWRDGSSRVDVSVSGLLATEWARHRYELARSLPADPTLRCGDDARSEWPTALVAGGGGMPQHPGAGEGR